jgi:hypothetical protein
MVGHPRTPWWRRGWDGKKTPDPVACKPCFLVWLAVGRGRVEVGQRWMDKAESREFRGTILVVFSLEGDHWWNSVRHGTYGDRFLPPILGWAVKSEIWHRYCFHAGHRCSYGGRKWLAIALNALTFVSELVSEVGRPARPRVVRVGDFSMVEAFRRASLVWVETWSRRFVRHFGSFHLCGQSSWSGFFRGLFCLIVDCGYPLFWYPTLSLWTSLLWFVFDLWTRIIVWLKASYENITLFFYSVNAILKFKSSIDIAKWSVLEYIIEDLWKLQYLDPHKPLSHLSKYQGPVTL